MTNLVLSGRYDVKIDTMGRFIVPKDFRDQIVTLCQNSLFLKPMTHYLVALPPQTVDRLMRSSISQNDPFDADDRDRRRQLGLSLHMVSMDVQGKIRIPEAMLQLFGAEGSAIIIGTGEDFEIWSAKQFSETYGEGGTTS